MKEFVWVEPDRHKKSLVTICKQGSSRPDVGMEVAQGCI